MKEPLEIKVSAKTPCTALAGSIVNAYREGRDITLTAIGPVPVAQAVKAIVIANRSLFQGGTVLVPIVALITRQISDKRTGQTVPWVVTTLRLLNLLDDTCKEEFHAALVPVA